MGNELSVTAGAQNRNFDRKPQPALHRSQNLKSTHRAICLACLALVCVLTSSVAHAQAVYGSISGTIMDSTSAGVVGAKVTITDQERNIKGVTTSGDGGHYAQSHLIIGQYRIQVEMAGFNTAKEEGVEVAVDEVRTVDITLKPGDVKEVVTVNDEAPLLKTERTDVATVLSERQVTDLPTFGRNFSNLLLLTPGAIQFNWNDTSTENPQGGIGVDVC